MANEFPWQSMRPAVAGLNGAVASAHPLATQAGLAMLRSGGNAVDAVVATAVALGVVEPYMSGPAGVGFLLLHQADTTGAGGRGVVLNFSGHAPAAATPDQFTPASQERGPRAALVPGNAAGWLECLRRYGTVGPQQAFAPAIELAERGFPLHRFNVQALNAYWERLNEAGRAIFGPPRHRVGEVLRQGDLARSLGAIADGGADVFYRGPLGKAICDYLKSQGGLLSADDLAGYQPEWTEPISVAYRGLNVRTCPPNCEGFQILETLKILEGFDLAALGHNTAAYIHVVSEAVKLATADRIRWGGDPAFHPVPVTQLLSDTFSEGRRRLVDRRRASTSGGERWTRNPAAGSITPGQFEGLTTHLAAVDAQGNVASITQSLGGGFGSGVYVPGTGITLNNFVFWCEIDPACPTPNLIAPGKRWSSCMSPVHIVRDGRFWFSIATPGSYGILHTTLQMALNVVEFGADVQAAIEAPRFRLLENTRLLAEDRLSAEVRNELTAMGHHLELIGDYSPLVGGGQAVMIDPASGARLAGADPRRDGYAAAF
jgi:gamma-glutamyltranspeptidase/glutathione hydrolase